MTDYSENILHLNDYYFAFRRTELMEIKNKLSEFILFYKYLTQKRKTLIDKRKILKILQKLRNK